MKLSEIYNFEPAPTLNETYTDMTLNQLFESVDVLTENVNARQLERLAGKNISGAFMEDGNGQFVAYASDGSRTEMMQFDENRNIIDSKLIKGGEAAIKRDQKKMVEQGFRKVNNPRAIKRIVKILLIIIGLGLGAAGIWLIFGPVITVIAGALWNLISTIGSVVGTVGSAVIGLFPSGGEAAGPFMTAVAAFLKNLAIGGSAIVGGILSFEVLNKLDDK